MSYKISDISNVNASNLNKKNTPNYINYLDTANITEGVINEIKTLVSDRDKIPSRAQRIVKYNDILISTVRPNLKHYGIIKKEIDNLIASTGFVVISVNPVKAISDYVYYHLTQEKITNYLTAIAETSTSTFPAITPSVIAELEIDLPDLESQSKIVNILSYLDKKIELNNRMNKNLEQMAQVIFKQWFVDFEFPNEQGEPYKSSGGKMVWCEDLGKEIPEGWGLSKVGEVTKIIRGASPRPIQDYLSDKGVPWVKISDATSSKTKYLLNTSEYIKEEGKEKSRIVKPGTLILSNSATPGIPKIMLINACVHDGWLIFDEYKNVTKEYLYCFLNEYKQEILSYSNGSVFRNLKTDILKNFPIVIPSKVIVDKSNVLFINIDKKIRAITLEIERLSALRDTLLPKLMSGEIDVSNIEL